MATQNLTTADAILQNVYRGPMVEQLNQETAMLDILTKTEANSIGTFTGRQIIAPVHSSRNRGRSGNTDGGALAVAGSQGTLDAIITIKYFSGGIELSDQVIKQTKSNVGAFTSALTLETEGCLTDLKKDVTRIVFGTGDGLLATISGTPSGTSITVDSGQYIAVGDPIDIVVKSTGATTNGILSSKVTAVTYTGAANSATQTNATLTISPGSAGALDNTYGVYIAGDRSLESDGLRNILSTGRTLHQINSSTAGNAFWDSTIKDFAQANPSEDGIMQLAQQIRQKGNGKNPDLGVLSLGGQRRLANTYTSERRLNDKDAVTIDGGYEAIGVSAGGKAIPVMADVDCPAGQGFLINRSQFGWTQIGEPDWLRPPDGGTMFVLKDGASLGTRVRIWQAWLAWDACLYNLAPNQSGKFINLNDDVPVVRA